MVNLVLMLVALVAGVLMLVWIGSKRLYLSMSIFIVVATVTLYSLLGGWQHIKAQNAYHDMVNQLNILYKDPNLNRATVETTLTQLAEGLPEHAFLWFRLGEIYERLNWFDKAKEAFEHALSLESSNQEIQIKYAYASAFAAGGQLDQAAIDVLHGLLKANPNHRAAKNLIAMDKFNHAQFVGASSLWQEMLMQTDAGNERNAIFKAHQKAILSIDEGNLPLHQGPVIRVNVQLPENHKDVQQNWPVFIMAKHKSKAGPPVAVTQLKVGDLPASVVLCSAQAMSKDVTLEDGQDIIVVARVAKSFNPLPQVGDIEGLSDSVTVQGFHSFDIIIDKTIN